MNHPITYTRIGKLVIIHRPYNDLIISKNGCKAAIKVIKARHQFYQTEASYLDDLQMHENALKMFRPAKGL